MVHDGIYYRHLLTSTAPAYSSTVTLPESVTAAKQATVFVYIGIRNPEVDFGLIRSNAYGHWDVFFSGPGHPISTYPIHFKPGEKINLRIKCHGHNLDCFAGAWHQTFSVPVRYPRHVFKTVVSIAGTKIKGSSIHLTVDGKTVSLQTDRSRK